jgi:hypothetical protein
VHLVFLQKRCVHLAHLENTFGGSILKNNMEVEAAMELQRHLDETGLHIVYKTYTSKLKVYILKK